MEDHLNSSHGLHKPMNFLCDECNFSTTEQSLLLVHEQDKHVNEENTIDGIEVQHKVTTHSESVKLVLLPCDCCDFHATSKTILEEHMISSHSELKAIRKNYNCELCEFQADQMQSFLKHVNSKHQDLKCDNCKYTSKQQTDLEFHKEHCKSKFACNECNSAFDKIGDLITHYFKEHQQLGTTPNFSKNTYNCTECDLMYESGGELADHVKSIHSFVKCDYCERSLQNQEKLNEHVFDNHKEVIMIHTMASQINELSEDLTQFKTFRMKCETLLDKIMQSQNEIKQEIFLLRNHKQTIVEPLACKSVTEASLSVSLPQLDSNKKLPSTDDRKPTILHMSDARGLIDNQKVEEATGASLKFEKIGRKRAGACSEFLPEMVSSQVSSLKPDCLILQTGSWRIESKEKHLDMDIFSDKQSAVIAATNTFNAAARAVRESSCVKKVILMKLPINKKFSATKKSLSCLYNGTLKDLKLKSQCGTKIIIADDRYYKTDLTSDIINLTASSLRTSSLTHRLSHKQGN